LAGASARAGAASRRRFQTRAQAISGGCRDRTGSRPPPRRRQGPARLTAWIPTPAIVTLIGVIVLFIALCAA
jgi:hypothetical protein